MRVGDIYKDTAGSDDGYIIGTHGVIGFSVIDYCLSCDPTETSWNFSDPKILKTFHLPKELIRGH